jgi:hypothetical protein
VEIGGKKKKKKKEGQGEITSMLEPEESLRISGCEGMLLAAFHCAWHTKITNVRHKNDYSILRTIIVVTRESLKGNSNGKRPSVTGLSVADDTSNTEEYFFFDSSPLLFLISTRLP